MVKKIKSSTLFLHISWPLLLHDYSVKLPSSRFMKEMWYVVTKKMLLLFLFDFFFLALDPAHFHLAGS